MLLTKFRTTTVKTEARNPVLVHLMPLLVLSYFHYGIFKTPYLSISNELGHQSFSLTPRSDHSTNQSHPLYVYFGVSYRLEYTVWRYVRTSWD